MKLKEIRCSLSQAATLSLSSILFRLSLSRGYLDMPTSQNDFATPLTSEFLFVVVARGGGELFWKSKNLFIQKIGNILTRSDGDEFSCYLLDVLGLVFYQAAVPLHCCALVLCHFRRYLTVFAPAPPVNSQTISVMLTNIKRACFNTINIKKPCKNVCV